MTSASSLAYAWRSLRRAPVFTAAVILTLTVGIGAATTIFTIVDAVLLRPLPYADPGRLVGAWHDIPALSLHHVEQTQGTYFTYKRLAHSLEDIAEYERSSVSVTDPDGRAEPQRMDVALATSNLFSVLGVSPILGRAYTTAEDAPKGPNVVVLSEGLWRARFAADRGVIGRRLVISGTPYEIIGVMPERFRFPDAGTKLWMPRQLDPNAVFPGGFSKDAVARLAPGVSIATAERELANVLPRMAELYPNFAPGVSTRMLLDQARPIPRLIPLREDIVGDVARTLWIVAAAAGLVLLVTCANVANLMLVRADGRYRELSVRAALGAGRGSVLTHFFTESALLAATSGVLALGASWLGVRALVNAGPSEIPRLSEVSIGGTTIVFTLLTALLVAAACSIIPAVRFLRSDPLAGLREGGRSGTAGGARQRARSLLVAAQMAFALVVLAASGLLFRSFQHLHAVTPGFNADGVTTFWVSAPPTRYPSSAAVVRFYATLTSRIAELPGVKSVGIASHLPLADRGGDHDPFYVEGDATYTKSIPPLQTYVNVDDRYFETMGVPLVAGRTFSRIDSPNVGDEAVISVETAKQFFHDSTGRRALGRRYHALPTEPFRTIVGVVRSVRDSSLATAPASEVYVPESVGNDTLTGGVVHTMAVVIRAAGDADAVSRAAQHVVHDMDPTMPTFDVRSMRAVMEGSIARLSFTMVILGVAAGVTLLLGIIGLYGVIAYIVTLRTREIGVRIALGAQPRAVMTMVTTQGLALSTIGIAAGVVLALVVARFLRSLLFEVAPSDPVTLGAASALLVLLALVASWIPARRAANIDPTEALRTD